MDNKEIKVVSQIDAEDCDMVVCGYTSYLPDDVHTECHFCGDHIVHRPHSPLLPVKVCIKCAAKQISPDDDFQFAVSEKTNTEVDKILESDSEEGSRDFAYAHLNSLYNKRFVETATSCGCFNCLKFFLPEEIVKWVHSNQTALCPFCEIDSVLTDNCGCDLTYEFLEKMKHFFFEE